MDRIITEKDIVDLNEKQKLEFWAAQKFLETYNKTYNSNYKIIELRDSPDIIVNNNKISHGIEVTHVFYDHKEAQTILGRRYMSDNDLLIYHGPMTDLGFTEMINESIARKAYKDYGMNTWLLIRTSSALFNENSLRRDLIQVPDNNFEQIWVLFKANGTIARVQ